MHANFLSLLCNSCEILEYKRYFEFLQTVISDSIWCQNDKLDIQKSNLLTMCCIVVTFSYSANKFSGVKIT